MWFVYIRFMLHRVFLLILVCWCISVTMVSVEWVCACVVYIIQVNFMYWQATVKIEVIIIRVIISVSQCLKKGLIVH